MTLVLVLIAAALRAPLRAQGTVPQAAVSAVIACLVVFAVQAPKPHILPRFSVRVSRVVTKPGSIRILEGRSPEPSGKEGLIDVRIIRALYRSAESGRPVSLQVSKKGRRPTLSQEIKRPPVKKPHLVHA